MQEILCTPKSFRVGTAVFQVELILFIHFIRRETKIQFGNFLDKICAACADSWLNVFYSKSQSSPIFRSLDHPLAYFAKMLINCQLSILPIGFFLSSGQSYKDSMIVNYYSGVIILAIFYSSRLYLELQFSIVCDLHRLKIGLAVVVAQLVERSLPIPDTVRIQSSAKFIEHLFTGNCIEKTKTKKKEAGNAQFFYIKKIKNFVRNNNGEEKHVVGSFIKARFVKNVSSKQCDQKKIAKCL